MTSTPIDWRIDSGGVGPARLGKPFPETLVTGDLGGRYVARFIADGQPTDAFAFDDPPLLVIFAGPFSQSTESDPTDASERYRAQAVAAVRGGAPIARVMIKAKGPHTADGLGVGSTFAELQKVHPDLVLSAIPATLGHDECVGHSPKLPGIGFVFATCAKAKSGEPVIRVDVGAVD